MCLTWPAMNRVLAESVRMVKDGGTVWLTHLIEPGRYDKASILTAVGMDRWDTAVRAVGGGNLIVRYMRPSSDAVHKTVQPCRYFIVFTKGSNVSTTDNCLTRRFRNFRRLSRSGPRMICQARPIFFPRSEY